MQAATATARKGMRGRTRLAAAVCVGLALSVGGCASDGSGGSSLGGMFQSDDAPADLALAALAKGDYVSAETHVNDAFQADPDSPYALLAAGILYQNTGRPAEAAAVYKRILALQPHEVAAVGTWFRQRPQAVTDIAASNLEILSMLPAVEAAGAGESVALGAAPQAGGSTAAPQSQTMVTQTAVASTPPPMATAPASGEPQPLFGPGAASSGRAAAPSSAESSPMMAPLSPSMGPEPGTQPEPQPSSPAGMPTRAQLRAQMEAAAARQVLPMSQPVSAAALSGEGHQNIANRFVALQDLLENQLITADEFQVRRAGNMGGLLPLTQPPAAAGIARPAPLPSQVVERLKTLRDTLESGEITSQQYAAEREAILEALLPASPPRRVPLMLPPSSLDEATAAMEQLRDFRQMGLVTEGQAKAEQTAIERALQSGMIRPMAASGGTGSAPPAPSAGQSAGRSSGSGASGAMGVHLASYKSESVAHEGWKNLLAKYPRQLGGMQPRFVKASVTGKGTFWRVLVGPVGSQSQAQQFCQGLKAAGQYCLPMRM